MVKNVVITGVGLITPLGRSPREVLGRVGRGEVATSIPSFDVASFACPFCAPVVSFDAEECFCENKNLRLMSRDAQMAVVAAHIAMEDAYVKADETYASEEIALYGSTGVSSLSVEEIARIIEYAAGSDGSLDLKRFGQVGLKRVRPVLSFRILANMPICFVSIFENIRGQNAVYAPWEGQGAQAIAAGIRAIRRGDVPCALVGSCDVKTSELSFINLQQLGVFESWELHGKGCIPGEGAAFLVLEDAEHANKRGKRAYAKITDYAICSTAGDSSLKDTFSSAISKLKTNSIEAVVAAGDGDMTISEGEQQAFEEVGLEPCELLRPKLHLGNLFAAAAAVQVGLAAELAGRGESGRPVLADCFGYGSEQASFALEGICAK